MREEKNGARRVRTAPQYSRPYGGTVYVTDCERVSGIFMTRDHKLWTGGVLLNLKGEVVARLPGVSAGAAHAVAVSGSGELYLAELSGKVQEFIRQ